MKNTNFDEWLEEMKNLIDWVSEGGTTSRFIISNNNKEIINSLIEKSINYATLNKNFVISKIDASRGNMFFKFEDLYIETSSKAIPKDFFVEWLERKANNIQKNNLVKNISILNPPMGYALLNLVEAVKENDEESIDACWKYICGESVNRNIKRKIQLVDKVKKETAVNFFLGFNKLIRSSSMGGWLIIFENMESITQQRLDRIRNEAYDSIRQILDMQGGDLLNECLILFCSNSKDFVNIGIHEYPALAERIYTESNISTNFLDKRQYIWDLTNLGN